MLAISLASIAPAIEGQTPATTLKASDIDRLTGTDWRGSLEYRDYTTNKQTTIRSTLLFTRLPARTDGASAWDMRVGYNDEPNENSRDTVLLSPDGRTFHGQRLIELGELSDGTLRFVTEQDGQDNSRSARFQFVYLLDASTVSIQKLVRYAESEPYTERHIYRWAR